MAPQDFRTAFPHGVSDLERLIHRQVAIEARSRRSVAAEHQLSELRVAKIVARVNRWLSEPHPVGLNEPPRQQRLTAALTDYRDKLQYYQERALAAFERSKEQDTLTMHFDGSPDDQRPMRIKKVRHTRKTSPGDIRYLQAAQRFAQSLAEVEAAIGRHALERDVVDEQADQSKSRVLR